MTEQAYSNIEGIFHFWIIHKSSGLTMFSQEFQSLGTNADTDIIGGYLIAILGFAQEMANQSIDFMQLQDIRISYSIQDNFVMVVITSNSADPNRIRKMLELVHEKFKEKYSHILDEQVSEISQFKSFARVTESIFEAETKYLTIIRSRADSLDDYFKKASNEWKELHEKITEYTYSLGKWGAINKITINPTIQKDLMEARKNALARLERIRNPETQVIKGEWV